jgi:hypothetical protein
MRRQWKDGSLNGLTERREDVRWLSVALRRVAPRTLWNCGEGEVNGSPICRVFDDFIATSGLIMESREVRRSLRVSAVKDVPSVARK